MTPPEKKSDKKSNHLLALILTSHNFSYKFICEAETAFLVRSLLILVLPAFNVTLKPKKAHFSLDDQELEVEVYARSVPFYTFSAHFAVAYLF